MKLPAFWRWKEFNLGLIAFLRKLYYHKIMKEIAPGITIDPKIRFGKPVIKGTRVPVDLIVGKIAGGMTIDEVAKEYDLKREQILAALRYAAEIVKKENLIYV
jgi:uncharacterized protein (DUF433 family)